MPPSTVLLERRLALAEGEVARLRAERTTLLRRLSSARDRRAAVTDAPPEQLVAERGLAGPAILAGALRELAAARRLGGHARLHAALGRVADAAEGWRERL